MKNALEIKNLKKTYNQQIVFQELNLTLEPNRVYGIMGPSGIGKTTLLKIIAGLEELDDGHVYIGDEIATSSQFLLEPHHRNIGFVFQESTLWPHMTMEENIKFAMSPSYDEKFSELLSIIGIQNVMDKYPNEVSEGEAKRVSIARAICSGAKLLLFDEPYSNLDKKLKHDLMDLIKIMQKKEGLTILMVSHDYSDHIYISDKIYEIRAGKIYEKN